MAAVTLWAGAKLLELAISPKLVASLLLDLQYTCIAVIPAA